VAEKRIISNETKVSAPKRVRASKPASLMESAPIDGSSEPSKHPSGAPLRGACSGTISEPPDRAGVSEANNSEAGSRPHSLALRAQGGSEVPKRSEAALGPLGTRVSPRGQTPARRAPVSGPRRVDDAAIARRAYELYFQRGMSHGRDVEDWLEAERQLARI
jgi:hypothetical protein